MQSLSIVTDFVVLQTYLMKIVLLTFLSIMTLSHASQAVGYDTTYATCQFQDIHFELRLIKNKLILSKTNSYKKEIVHAGLDSIIYSSNNYYEHINMQFVSEKIGFIYGNEQGYGQWPFLFKTIDGGQHWKRLLFEPYELGINIAADHFYMFNEQQGILIYNYNKQDRLTFQTNTKLRYLLTQDGGDTWKEYTKKLSRKNVTVTNIYYRLNCTYNSNGQVKVNILRAPWEAAKGKRSIKDRTIIILESNDFGRKFKEINLSPTGMGIGGQY